MFKPQSVSVSIIFLTVISYVGGNAMAYILPQRGPIGRWLNPHTFNSKEHLAIVIMSSSASEAARATEVLAAQKLYYDVVPHSMVAILLLFSSQLLGYGVAGILRRSLVYPTKMVWPSVLPLSSLIEALHRERAEMRKRFNFFCGSPLVLCFSYSINSRVVPVQGSSLAVSHYGNYCLSTSCLFWSVSRCSASHSATASFSPTSLAVLQVTKGWVYS